LQDTGIESTIKYRLLEIERAVRRALDKVKGTRLISPYEEEIKNTIEDELNKFCDTLKQLSDSNEIVQLKQEAQAILMDRIRISSDLLLGRIEDILSGETEDSNY
jgi:predicted ribosome quality control (RQC) complex YloA/Tae2 family protein